MICQYLLTRTFDPETSPGQQRMACQLLNPSASLSAEQQILIYRHSITGAQQAVLDMLYPVCRQILGENCFNTLTRDYVWRFDSNCADLNQYGQFFANMIEQQQQKHASLKELPYLADLARLEWAWQKSLFMADNKATDFELLQNLINEYGDQLVPQLAPAVFLLSSPWPVYDVWQAHRQARPVEEFKQQEQAEYYVIARQDSVNLDKVSTVIYQFLRLSQQGQSLSTIAEKMGSQAEQVFQQLTHMFQQGWLCGLQTPSQEP